MLKAGVREGFKALRKQLGMSRRAVAVACRIDPSYVTLIERDSYAPSRLTCLRIADGLVESGARRVDADRWVWACGYVPRSAEQSCKRLFDAFLESCAATTSAQMRIATRMRQSFTQPAEEGGGEPKTAAAR